MLLITLSTWSLPAQTWTQLQVPNTRNLYGCWFDVNQPDTGMAVGWYIQNNDRLPFGFYTKNGGNSITAGSLFQVYFYASSDVWFTNSYNGVVVGNGIIQTTDGGNNWNLIVDAATTQAGILEDVMFTNATDGYAVGQRYDFNYTSFEGMIYKTSNAGGSWTDYTVSQEVNNENTQLHAVYSTGNGIVYAGGENTIGGVCTLFKSTNDGVTWSPMTFNQNIWSLFFTSADTGFAATTNGLYQTTNAGINWSNILPTTSALHTIQIKNGFGFAAGENGLIYMTNDNGNSWTSVTSPVTTTIAEVFVLSANLAYAVGASGTFLKYTNTVGLVELPNSDDLIVSADGQKLNVRWNPNSQTTASIELINMNGVVEKKVTDSVTGKGQKNIEIDLTSLTNGLYLVRFIQGKEIRYKKVVLIK